MNGNSFNFLIILSTMDEPSGVISIRRLPNESPSLPRKLFSEERRIKAHFQLNLTLNIINSKFKISCLSSYQSLIYYFAII